MSRAAPQMPWRAFLLAPSTKRKGIAIFAGEELHLDTLDGDGLSRYLTSGVLHTKNTYAYFRSDL